MDTSFDITLNTAVYAPFAFAIIIAVLWKAIGSKTAAAIAALSAGVSFVSALAACWGFYKLGSNMAMFAPAEQLYLLPHL